MSILTPFAQFIRQALKYPLFSPFLPPENKVLKDYSYSAGQKIGTLECPPEQGLPKTGQTFEYQPGDDGTYQAGYPKTPPRFIDNGDGTITDKATGLMWPKDGDGPGCNNGWNLDWAEAIAFCEALNFAGHTDWRLPNIKELLSIVDFGRGEPAIDPIFINTSDAGYWVSTTYDPGTDYAWLVDFGDGKTMFDVKEENYSMRAVRGGI